MATPTEPDRAEAQARARSGLSAAELAAGLITEELWSRPSSKSNRTESNWPDPEPTTPTLAERIAQYRKKATEWIGVQIRRMRNQSTYAEVINRQDSTKRKHVGEELWKIVRADKSLMKDYDNDRLPTHPWTCWTRTFTR